MEITSVKYAPYFESVVLVARRKPLQTLPSLPNGAAQAEMIPATISPPRVVKKLEHSSSSPEKLSLPRSDSSRSRVSTSSCDKENGGSSRSVISSRSSSPRSVSPRSSVPRPLSAVAKRVRQPVISAQAWLVMDAHTGGVIHGYRHNERRCIASMTKITTASVVLQLAVQNPWLLSSNVTVSREAATTIGTSANLHTGDSVTVQDLLYGLMLPSGNDAAVALSEHLGQHGLNGSFHSPPSLPTSEAKRAVSPRPPRPPAHTASPAIAPVHCRPFRHARSLSPAIHTEASSDIHRSVSAKEPQLPSIRSSSSKPASDWFVNQMNVFATTSGAQNTMYSNPHGMDSYPDPATHQSTAIDVARITLKSMQHPQFRNIVRTVKHVATVNRLKRQRHDPFPMTRKDSIDLFDECREESSEAARPETISDAGSSCDYHTLKVTWTNTNRLLTHKSAANGVKTGVTKLAGSCLCSQFDVDSRSFVVIVMGCISAEARFSDTLKLLKWLRRCMEA